MENYELENSIGFGSFSTVYKAKRKQRSNENNFDSNEIPLVVAIKIVKIESNSEIASSSERCESDFLVNSKQIIDREISHWKSLDYRNVCKLFEVIFLESDGVAFVMEYAENGDLLSMLGDHNRILSVKMVKYYFKQLCCAVHYLHGKNLIHGDIKLENIFLSGEAIKLGDFGLARGSFEVLGEFGTVEYAAPELITRETETNVDPFKADLWALGVVLYTLIFKEFPFDGTNAKIIKRKILNDEVSYCPFPEESEIEDKDLLLNVLKRLLNKKPEMRPSTQELLQSNLFK